MLLSLGLLIGMLAYDRMEKNYDGIKKYAIFLIGSSTIEAFIAVVCEANDVLSTKI